jgi:hypothetical protein
MTLLLVLGRDALTTLLLRIVLLWILLLLVLSAAGIVLMRALSLLRTLLWIRHFVKPPRG